MQNRKWSCYSFCCWFNCRCHHVRVRTRFAKGFPGNVVKLAPKDIEYAHDNTWHDGNGHSHVRASLIGPGLAIPIIEGHLTVGTWQQIVLVEMDTGPRERKIILQVIGE